jgi:RNA polymerase sigma factor (sigma-70 family)
VESPPFPGASTDRSANLSDWARQAEVLALCRPGAAPGDLVLSSSKTAALRVLDRPGQSDRELLYADFQPLVRRMIRQYGGEDAERRKDLVGEIYCRFCTILDAYDPGRGVPLRPYLVRQLTASVYTYARQHWRSEKREVRLDSSEAGAASWEPGGMTDPTGEWDDRMHQADVLRSLPQAISKLPKRQRQVVIWRYYEQKSFEEIAETLGVRLATARSILRHGLNNLRKWAAENHLT